MVLIQVLKTLQHLPTPFISAFILIHLAAPVAANFGGSNAASQMMILGREYYQTSFGEQYLLMAPLGIHIAAGVVRRCCVWSKKIKESGSLRPAKPNLLVSTAYVAMALVPVHFLVNRYYPSLDEDPIFGLSPSQLNYEYVKFGLDRWPIRTWLLYGIMVPAVTLHGAEGLITLARKRFGVDLRIGIMNTSIALAAAILALGGLFVISRESISIYSSEALRYVSSYCKSAFYQ